MSKVRIPQLQYSRLNIKVDIAKKKIIKPLSLFLPVKCILPNLNSKWGRLFFPIKLERKESALKI